MNSKSIIILILLSISSIVSYAQGEPPKNYSGEWVVKYKSGKINFKGKYINGQQTGECVYYYENGKIRYNGNYVEGGKDGIWVAYFDTGEVRFKVKFEKGSQIGNRIYY